MESLQIVKKHDVSSMSKLNNYRTCLQAFIPFCTVLIPHCLESSRTNGMPARSFQSHFKIDLPSQLHTGNPRECTFLLSFQKSNHVGEESLFSVTGSLTQTVLTH